MDMRPDPFVQHQFFMPQPQLCVAAAMVDEASSSSFLAAGTGGGGGGEGVGTAASSGTKRRFTEEQIRSLETMFHAHHAKLEPREKAELARELGLQPRQVAIWFQNKLARWRSKQLEHDYAALRAEYDALHASVEALRQEKLALAAQLNELSGRLREREEERAAAGATMASSSSCCGDEEAEDDKRNVLRCVDVPESCVLGGACATPADVVSVESECDNQHLVDYGDGFPEPFCATPELWEPWPWPLVEWNAVA